MKGFQPTLKKENVSSFFNSLDFLLSHFQKPLFPRSISTRKSKQRQFKVFSEEEMIKAYEAANFQNCKFSAYPPYTDYKGIQRRPPNFILAGLDISSFKNKQRLESALKSTVKKIKITMNGNPTVLWTGNSYHIYQPVEAVIFEQFVQFEGSEQPSVRFLRFAEQYLTNKKSDPSHNPSFKSCMIFMPGSINSKGSNEVKVIQKWDEQRPHVNTLCRAFYEYLISEKIKEAKLRNKARSSQNESQVSQVEKQLIDTEAIRRC